ncbi:hypothetical protein [Anaerosporobacter sp.]|uniref:hypothetical protein n=1 Tax=Anaerosporobacter sp. TaxID=1872529 RepID=UPI00286ED43F|nr:hypothetical protein [Anaerosporobacter sp.]
MSKANKIGARVLTENECKLILPTYEKIFEQVKAIREEAAEIVKRQIENENENQKKKKDYHREIDQKTNNIGILGCRGAGKTSLLKTVRERINDSEDNEDMDVILPIIIPENMSTHSTLMATILGMFSTIVEERHKKYIKEQKSQIYMCEREHILIKKYNEVIKQYTYIQKDYRDILLNQFTSENDYVKQSAKVFNSDTEFIRKFNDFINELLGTEGEKQKALIYIFIDDIDLSTHRCSDVVKTLLSYLSNSRIVTFISGDLETFEEALTLEFLRAEKALDSSIFDTAYLGDNNKTLLERKQVLAYEYLKKIIPPVFRHAIKRWTLSERGNYAIDLENSRLTLSDLLCDTLKAYVQPSYFRYVKLNASYEIDEKDKYSNLSYTYNLFDDTSRGLNNVYNVLLEINSKTKSDGSIDLSDRKLIIETIVASNPSYNSMRDKIFNDMIVLGGTEEDSKVIFENAEPIINSSGDSYDELKKDVKFKLFILMDFAHRLLNSNVVDIIGEYYNNMKEKTLYLLLSSTVVSKRVCSDQLKVILPKMNKSEDISSNEDNTLYYGAVDLSISDFTMKVKKSLDRTGVFRTVEFIGMRYEGFCMKDFIIRILFKCKMEISLYLFNNLPMDKIVECLNVNLMEDESRIDDLDELLSTLIVCFFYALQSYCYLQDNKNYGELMQDLIKDMYEDFGSEFNYIQMNVSKSTDKNICSAVFDTLALNFDASILDGTLIKNLLYMLVIDKSSKLIGYNNDIVSFIKKMNSENNFEKIFEEVNFVKVSADKYKLNKIVIPISEKEKEEYIDRRKIIQNITQNNLWKMNYCDSIKTFIVQEIKNLVLAYCWEESINLANLEESYKKFLISNKGVSKTKAKKLLASAISNEIGNYSNINRKVKEVNFSKFYFECLSLSTNLNVWYGRYEASEMVNALNECYYDVDDSVDISYLQFLLCHYIVYKSQEMNLVEISRKAEIMSQFTELLSLSHEQADRAVLSMFIEEINNGVEDNNRITEERLDKLFHKAKAGSK